MVGRTSGKKALASQPLTLDQVIESRADGTPRYPRPLWLLFVAGKPRPGAQLPAVAPTPRQAEASYDERFSIEYAIRFGKQELGLVSGQFKGLAAAGRAQTWVELVATVYWLRWALRAVVDEQKATWPTWWQSRKLTPGAMRRESGGTFPRVGLG